MRPERWQQVRQVFELTSALVPEARSAYLDEACGTDAELRREVESLLWSEKEAGKAFLEKPAVFQFADGTNETPAFTRTGTRIGVYQILEPVGRGGMGEVYRAVRADGQYEKEVAVKLVRGGFDSRAVLQRFVNERQILASLDHPNIARLLDGGTTDDGAPYLVMELIQGQALDTYCDARGLNTTQRLQLFLDVCGAIQYAHQRLVIHRDIKPGNILVTADGAPKLLDFGVAKIFDPVDREVTLFRPMTPEYASPEQVRGETITTATDVYSLGVVLYELLTGHAPFEKEGSTPHELARAICETEPVRPSTVVLRPTQARAGDQAETKTPEAISQPREGTPARLQRRLRGDLDNIVLKAMRKEPQRRYASVEHLMEDVRRHLEGRPVSATPDSFTYRTRKFVRRNRIAVAAAGLIVLVLVGGVVATLREARIAEAERRRAEKRFNDVRALANSFLFEFHDAIQHLPGATPARELVVKRALEYLDSLSQESANNLSLLRDLGTAYERVGAVQGSPHRDNLGNTQGALASFRKSAAIRERALSMAPDDQTLRRHLARSYSNIGEVEAVSGDTAGSLASYRKALNVATAEPKPTNDLLITTQSLYVNLGDAQATTGDLSAAAESYQKSIDLVDRILQADPKDLESVRDKAVALIHLGDVFQTMGRRQDALVPFRSAAGLFTSLLKPGNAQSRRDVGVANERIAQVLLQLGDKAGALKIEQQALADDKELLSADPSNALLRRDLYSDYYRLATVRAAMGDFRAAIANQQESIALTEKEAAANPANTETRDDLQIGYFHLGEWLEKNRDPRPALRAFQKAVEIAAALSDGDPKDQAKRANLAESLMKQSDLHLQLADRALALAGYRKALAIAETVVAAAPDNADIRRVEAQLYQKLGAYSLSSKSGAEAAARGPENCRNAVPWFKKSLDAWKYLQEHKTLDTEYTSSPGNVERQITRCDEGVTSQRAR